MKLPGIGGQTIEVSTTFSWVLLSLTKAAAAAAWGGEGEKEERWELGGE